MTMGWIGVNTWVVLDLALGILDALRGRRHGTGLKYIVGIAIMVDPGRDRDRTAST